MPLPELAIIIPTLNEAENLPLLLEDLARQTGVVCEVIVSDGGSVDETCDLAEGFFTASRLTGRVLDAPRGRGRQLNAGAVEATAPWVLFLHADSRLPDAGQLRAALDLLHKTREESADDALAGRFILRFDGDLATWGYGLSFYETKARLGRPGCIHGDQGMLMTRSFFQRIGPFREDLQVMEDTSLAEVIRVEGRWLLLPGEIVTSTRRFTLEGLKARQTLNALLMNFHAIGWPDFIAQSPAVYQQQDRARPLQLQPFFRLINQLLTRLPYRERLAVWTATGGYVRSQVWQLGLALDCRKARPEGSQAGFWLTFCDRWIDPLTDHSTGRGLTAILVWLWFQWQLLSGWRPFAEE